VRRQAIAAAGKLRAPELVPALVEQFQRRETALEAASALVGFGPGIEPQLQGILVDEGSHADCRRGVCLVLQRLGTREAADALVATLAARDPAVRKTAARALARLCRRHRGLRPEAARIERAVHAELSAARAALAVLRKLMLSSHGHSPRTPSELLGLALQEERDARVLQALLLLEVLLPDVRLDVVAENLRSESGLIRANAIEVLDNALPDPWKRLAMAALDETGRRGDQVPADPRSPAELAAALIGGETGAWVGACTVRWALEGAVPLRPLVPAFQAALRTGAAPLREAAALAIARAAPKDAQRLLAPLAADPAPSVRRTVGALLARKRASA
jgi:HEAT repeat protein